MRYYYGLFGELRWNNNTFNISMYTLHSTIIYNDRSETMAFKKIFVIIPTLNLILQWYYKRDGLCSA